MNGRTIARLVATTGCPTLDAEVATYADVVLRASREEVVLLRYAPRFRCWYVCGCQSVTAAERETIREAAFYWKGVGYVEDASFAYAFFLDKPLRADRQWNTFYRDLAGPRALRLLRR